MQNKIKTRKLEILYEQSYFSILLTSILAISMVFVFSDRLPINVLFSWLAIFIIISSLRLYNTHAFIRTEKASFNLTYWFSWHIVGVGVSGVVWGGFILLLAGFTSGDAAYLNLASICAAGLCAAAAAVYSFSFLSFLLFTIPVLCPLGVFLIVADHTTFNTLGYFVFLFLITMVFASWRLNVTTSHSLRLQLENQELLTALGAEKKQVIEINKQLEEDIKSRIQTEAILLYEKQIAESNALKLKTLSIKDGLTGINNRRRFDEALYDEWNRAARQSTTISLILCDIDKFKEYNDTYGHLEGDKCLIKIARLIEDYARRAGDLAARFGGEEFAIILPDTGHKHAYQIAEQLRKGIAELAIPHETSSVTDVITLSFGVHTMYPEKSIPENVLIARADKALYQAKKRGRNNVTAYEEVVEFRPKRGLEHR